MITYTFLAIIVVFSVYGFNDRSAMNKYMFHPYSIHHGREHYRFLTHAFIHGDFIHLAFNCLTLFGFGLDIEESLFPMLFESDKIGKLMYLILFTGGIYAASITEYLRNKNNPDYSSLGASGAISSVMFCWIMLVPKGTIGLFFIPMPGWVAGILLLGVSYYLIMRKKKSSYTDNISHESHFWGAMFGIAFILVAKPVVFKHFIYQIFGSFM
jgi:membrane associated rhomboid family serine protease